MLSGDGVGVSIKFCFKCRCEGWSFKVFIATLNNFKFHSKTSLIHNQHKNENNINTV